MPKDSGLVSHAYHFSSVRRLVPHLDEHSFTLTPETRKTYRQYLTCFLLLSINIRLAMRRLSHSRDARLPSNRAWKLSRSLSQYEGSHTLAYISIFLSVPLLACFLSLLFDLDLSLFPLFAFVWEVPNS